MHCSFIGLELGTGTWGVQCSSFFSPEFRSDGSRVPLICQLLLNNKSWKGCDVVDVLVNTAYCDALLADNLIFITGASVSLQAFVCMYRARRGSHGAYR